ncbi:Pectinesterase inhibitor domain [Arabidopsis suecica]|uniref:Pectinesterase n=1 Tax=Arabidopsis suecica TaxID=45249 RepID=A0A8T1ZZT6_ARASU|nr:Pectinesterase inhibitor domain [Arabidopsis suecica]
MATTSFSLPNYKFRIKLSLFLILNLLSLHTLVCAHSSNSKFTKFSRYPNSDSSSRTQPSTSSNKGFLNSVQLSLDHALFARSLAFNLTLSHRTSQTLMLDPVNDCLELLDDTLDMLSRIVVSKRNDHVNDDVHTWLSAALTNQETCEQSLSEKSSFNKDGIAIDSFARNLTGLLTNSLDMFVSDKRKSSSSSSLTGGRKLLSDHDYPTWISTSDRKLLEASVEELRPHAVVAADGSGTHMSVAEALASLEKGGGRSVIHLTAGTYKENLNIPSKQKNVMLVGDGKGKTVIIGSRSNRGGWNTYQSATVAAMGDGFIARDITFVNSAGPNSEQAVALRVGSDRSVVYRCSIDGYQDSLYTLSKRQFYRETDITGTVDFIFGNSAVVFQSCNLVSRKGSSEQNYVTAQGRSDPNQNTGISIHNCRITGSTKTYLGRPWKQYSRTVVMQSFIDGSIHPSGWSPWSSSFALKTLYYGEFGNSGPGSSVSGRVSWAGYHPALTLTEAQGFTVSGFIDGKSWLPSTGVVFDSGLL